MEFLEKILKRLAKLRENLEQENSAFVPKQTIEKLKATKTEIDQEIDQLQELWTTIDQTSQEGQKHIEKINKELNVLCDAYDILNKEIRNYSETNGPEKGNKATFISSIKKAEKIITNTLVKLRTEQLNELDNEKLIREPLQKFITTLTKEERKLVVFTEEAFNEVQEGLSIAEMFLANFSPKELSKFSPLKTLPTEKFCTTPVEELYTTPTEKSKLSDLGKELKSIADADTNEKTIQEKLLTLTDYDDLFRKCLNYSIKSYTSIEELLAFESSSEYSLEDTLNVLLYHPENFPEHAEQLKRDLDKTTKILGLEDQPDRLKENLINWSKITGGGQTTLSDIAKKYKNKESSPDDNKKKDDETQLALQDSTQGWDKIEQLAHEGTGGIELEEALAQMARDARLGTDVSTKIQATIAKLQRQDKSTDKILETIKKDFDKAFSDTQTPSQTHLGGLASEQTARTFSVHTPEAGPITDYDNHSSNTGLHSFEIHVFDPAQQPVWIHERHPLNPSQTGMIVQTPGLPLNEQDMNRQGAVVPLTTGTIWLPSDPEIYIPDQHHYETKQPDRINDIIPAPAEFTPLTPDEPAQKSFYQQDYVQKAVVSCAAFADAMVKNSGIYRALHSPKIAKMAKNIHHKGIHKATFDLMKKMQQQSHASSSSSNTARNIGNNPKERRVANTSSPSTKKNIRSNQAAKRINPSMEAKFGDLKRGLQNTASQSFKFKGTNLQDASHRAASTRMGIDMRGSSTCSYGGGWTAAPRCR